MVLVAGEEMFHWHMTFLAFVLLAGVSVNPANGADPDSACDGVPVVELKGQSGSSASVPLFGDQTVLLDIPAGEHDSELVVLARINRSAKDLAVRIGLQEPYSTSELEDADSLASEINRVNDTVVWAPERFSFSLDELKSQGEFVFDVSSSLGIEPVSLAMVTGTLEQSVQDVELAQTCPPRCCCVTGLVCCPLATCVNCGGQALCCPTQEP